MKKLLPLFTLLLLLETQLVKAQCVAGTSIITWQTATTGSATIVPGGAPAGGPPATITDATVGCGTAFNFTINIADPNNVYDKIRSSTSGTTLGTYGTPYFTIVMDNIDGGCGAGLYTNPTGGCTNTQNAPYAAGNKIVVTFTFDKPVVMNNFRIDDIDASDIGNPPLGSSSFQDKVVFSATDVNGTNVPITLTVGSAGRVNIVGQTATAVWAAGVNYNVSPDDLLGQVTAKTTTAIKSFTMEYVAGPNELNPAQQAIRLGQFTICCPVVLAISGNVYNDLNGLIGTPTNTVDGIGIGSPSAIQLYANLTDPVTGKVVAVTPVAAGGAYNFANIAGQTTYNVVISTTQGTVGNPAPSPSLPANWVNTGDNIGAAAGNDGTTNGILSVVIGTTSITNVNFGIEQLPNTGVLTMAAQANPGGTANYTIPAASFSGTDPDAGSISFIKITAFPSNATTITINGTTYTSASFPVGGVTVPTLANGQPTQTITVDPFDGTVSVVIPYASIDNAGKQDPTPGSLTIPFAILSLSGNVYNDINGLIGTPTNTVDGIGTSLPSGTQLYVNLLNAAGTTVVASMPVNADGTYSFSQIIPNTNYVVQLSINQGTAGGAAPVKTLPANWVNTGENIGAGAGNDGTVNGLLPVSILTSSLTNANMGIEELPSSADNFQASQNNPGGTTSVAILATAFSGTDPSGGNISAIRLTTFPVNATSITINGTLYTTLLAIQTAYPNGIPTNAAGNPTVTISVDPTGAAGSNVNVQINYATIDNAGKEDPTPAFVLKPFAAAANLILGGSVFNDVNGLIGTPVNTVDGVGTGLPSGTQVYANLINATTGLMSGAGNPITSSGAYAFFVTASTNYIIQLSTNAGVNGSLPPAIVLPANWTNTGENIGASAGNDGTVNGIIAVNMLAVSITNVNFGIQQLPNSGVIFQPTQANPGGTINATVSAAAFSGTDPDAGIISAIKITAFPTNATSITINGTQYTTLLAIQTAYPNGIPTNSTGQPTVPILVDPINGSVSVVINYASVDNAGKQDATPGSVTIPFASVNISGNVYNDLNGLTGTPVNTVDGVGIGSPSGIQLHANLLNAAGDVVATIPVNAGGDYSFINVAANASYTIQISTNVGVPTNPAPADALPTNWVSTGENFGATAGNDGTINTRLPITVTTTDVTNANFGIEQLPNTGLVTLASVVNPGGSNNYTVSATSFSGTDPDAGIVASIRITSFPTNASSITINGINYTEATFPIAGVIVPTNASGQPAQIIMVDPIDGNVTVVISYASIDNAGKEDATPGAVNIPFSTLQISGNVFDDGNGLNAGGNVDGTGISLPSGTQLYANLLNAVGTIVIATAPINADGTYSFYGLAANTNYTVQLSINQGTAGSATPSTALPASWVNTGEDCCDNIGSDGTTNGLVSVAITTTDLSNANFGINKIPEATNILAASQVNPGGTVQVAVPTLVGTDVEDGAMGATKTIRIDVLPTNAILYYSGAPVVSGVAIPNYNPALLTIDPDPSGPLLTYQLVNFQYSFQDAAGSWDALPNTVTMEFLEPVVFKGTVYNDANGSANNTHQTIQDGIETGTDGDGQLFAYLIGDPLGANTVSKKIPVNADGTWSFGSNPVSGTIRIIITSTDVAIGAAAPSLTVPAGWGNTSPLDTTIVYNNPPGLLIQDVNFGIEQLPESFDNTQPSQVNPGGIVNVTVPATAFGGEDVAIGIISSIRITSFPANTTSITINGITYTSATFLAGGVTIPTDAFGQPTQTISADPLDGSIDVTIPFVTIDNAGREDVTPAFVVLPFSAVLPVRSITLNGNLNAGVITINWNTLGELDVNKFELQRSLNGVNFTAISNQLSKGDGDRSYRAVDNQIGINGKVTYYRIKTIDKNGNYSYSGVIKINLDELKGVTIRPNPFTSVVNLQFNVQIQTNGTVKLYNMEGKQVYGRYFKLAQGLNSIEANNLEKLPAGMYILELNIDGAVTTEKIIKQ
jgi:Secretion system C-terminal sorting domain